jgi:hypothetical protein
MLLHVHFVRALSHGHGLSHSGSGNKASHDLDFWINFHGWCVVLRRIGWQWRWEDGRFHHGCCRGRVSVDVAIVKKLQWGVGNGVSVINRIESVS